jgi:hypothetical protein
MYFSMYRVYSVNTDNILKLIYEILCTIKRRLFTTEYLCMLFLGDSVKRRLVVSFSNI